MNSISAVSDIQNQLVSVVVVNYNTCPQLRKCLAALGSEYEVVVVDNASTDDSVEVVSRDFPHVKLIQNPSNRGFGEANNIGIKAASHPLVLLLNSDAYAHPGAIAKLASLFKDSSVAAAGGRLLNPDGTLQNSSSGPLTLWAVFCEQTYLENILRKLGILNAYWNSRTFKSTGETEQVMGACLMMRPLELFDERFFLYCEDTELCKRLRMHGQILYEPSALFTHELGTSSSDERWKAVARYNYGKELYFEIHQGKFAGFVCLLLNRMGAKLRMYGWLIVQVLSFGQLGKGKVRLFWNVLMAPFSGPPDPRKSQNLVV